MELKLRYYPDPMLRERAAPVEEFDSDLRELGEAMVEAMYRENGIGLAATQVGVPMRIIVLLQMRDPDDNDAPPLVLVNPRVVEASGELWSLDEGCLSMPGLTAPVKRPRHVVVEYQTVEGKTERIEDEGMLGRILLHETDHLDGKLFIDYLSTAQKSLIKTKLKEIAKDYSS